MSVLATLLLTITTGDGKKLRKKKGFVVKHWAVSKDLGIVPFCKAFPTEVLLSCHPTHQ